MQHTNWRHWDIMTVLSFSLIYNTKLTSLFHNFFNYCKPWSGFLLQSSKFFRRPRINGPLYGCWYSRGCALAKNSAARFQILLFLLWLLLVLLLSVHWLTCRFVNLFIAGAGLSVILSQTCCWNSFTCRARVVMKCDDMQSGHFIEGSCVGSLIVHIKTLQETRPIFRLRNDLYCVGWGVKLYSLTHSLTRPICTCYAFIIAVYYSCWIG